MNALQHNNRPHTFTELLLLLLLLVLLLLADAASCWL